MYVGERRCTTDRNWGRRQDVAGRLTPQQEEFLRRHDAALWRTLEINELIDSGGLTQVAPIPVTFASQIGADERFLGAGPFELLEFAAVGDGSYTHDSSFFFASGAMGLALTGGMAAARAIGNTQRRAQAAADARARWKILDTGQLWVSQYGFYLRSHHGFFVWAWPSIHAMELIGPGRILLDGDSQNGSVHWILQSDWSELAFTLWARERHPQHPQFLSRAWVTPGWEERTLGRGHQLPPAPSGRWCGIQDV